MAGRNGMTQGGIGALDAYGTALSYAPGFGPRPGPRPIGPVRPGPRPSGPDRELQPVTPPPPFSVGVPVMPSPPSPRFNPPIYSVSPGPRPTFPPIDTSMPVMPGPRPIGRPPILRPVLEDDNFGRGRGRGKFGFYGRRRNKVDRELPPVTPPPPVLTGGETPLPEDLPPIFLNEGGQVPRKIFDPVSMGFIDNPAYQSSIEESFGEAEEMVSEPKLPSGGPAPRTSKPALNQYGLPYGTHPSQVVSQSTNNSNAMSGYNPPSNIPYEALGLTPPPPRRPNVALPEIDPNNDSAFVLPSDFQGMPSGGGKGGAKGGPVSTTITRPPGKGGASRNAPVLNEYGLPAAFQPPALNQYGLPYGVHPSQVASQSTGGAPTASTVDAVRAKMLYG